MGHAKHGCRPPHLLQQFEVGRRTGLTNGDPAANAFDDLAIAPDKQALLNGQKATFANYTSYSRGINGIMIDIANLAQPAGLSVADFEFRTGNSNNPGQLAAVGRGPVPDHDVREGAGVDGSDRVTIIFPDGAVKKTWLQVKVKATDATGLATPDVHYWGNAIGETGNLTTNAYVDVSDSRGVRSNPHPSTLNPAPLDDKFDFNRDKLVNVQDDAFVRANPTNALTALKLIDLTGVGGAAEGEGGRGGCWLVVVGWWWGEAGGGRLRGGGGCWLLVVGWWWGEAGGRRLVVGWWGEAGGGRLEDGVGRDRATA